MINLSSEELKELAKLLNKSPNNNLALLPLEERHKILQSIVPISSHIQCVKQFTDLKDIGKSNNLIYKKSTDRYHPTTVWSSAENPVLREDNKQFMNVETLSTLVQLSSKGKVISGTAIKEGYHNGKFYPFTELMKSYKSLVGKELRFGHIDKLVVGKVIDTWLNYSNHSIDFIAEVENELMAVQIASGDYAAVSVGVWINSIPPTKSIDAPIAVDMDFQELSIVKKPACVGALIKHVSD